MNRIKILKNHLFEKQKAIVDSAYDYLYFSDFLTEEDEIYRKKFREFLEAEIKPYLYEYIERAEFPLFAIKKIGKMKILHNFLPKKYGGFGKSLLMIGVLTAEISRIDGSEEQKNEYLLKMANLEYIGGWCLTEPDFGSDASSLITTARKTSDGWVINGRKRWIGNCDREMFVCYARNVDTKNVECFIIDKKKCSGITVNVIKHKLACRSLQNGDIVFNNVVVEDSARLPLASDFQNGTEKILLHSRVMISWWIIGLALGIYDTTIKYVSERKQFKTPISGFQLSQEKLARMMANIQAMLMIAFRSTTLLEQKNLTIGQASISKAWISKASKEVAFLGRELLGGNGIIHDNIVIKHLNDIEVGITGEGTYEINSLIGGRELTGIQAFKSKK